MTNIIDTIGKSSINEIICKFEVLTDKDKYDNLRFAIETEKTDLFKALFTQKHKLDVNYVFPDNEETLLHVAALYDNLEIMKFLLDNGADKSLSKLDKYGISPLHRAAQHSNIMAIKLFKEFSASLKERTGVLKRTLLHCAAETAHEYNPTKKLMMLLLENGVDPEAKDLFGKTAGDLFAKTDLYYRKIFNDAVSELQTQQATTITPKHKPTI